MGFSWDGFSFDAAAHRLSGPDGDIHVEPQVFDVLGFLVENRDRVVTKAEVLDAVWGDQFVSESALTTRIKQVRQALGDDGKTQKYVRSVHGRGYQFVGVVESSGGPSDRGGPTAADLDPDPDSGEARPLQLALEIAVDTEYPFVGRTGELTEGRETLQTGRSTNSQIYVGGVPGAGKSRLAIELLEQAAADGAFVCAGRCENAVTSGLQAVRDAFAQLASVHPGRVGHWANGIEGPLLSLIPSLVDRLPHEPTPVDAYAGIDVFLTAFERVAATGPVVLMIDDLQWSDEPTRTFLGRVHRRLRDRPITTVATYRAGRSDLPTEVHHWIQQQRRGRNVADLRLGDLEPEDARQLVSAVIGDEQPRDELLAVTDGHCLFLTESLRDLQLGQDTSDSIAELISARLERQSEAVQDVVRAGALLGTEFSFSTASGAAGLAAADALTAIEAAIEAELLHETSSPARFRFSHQLVPQAINDSLPKARRAALHKACADVLADEGADETEIAFHRLGAVPLVAIDDAVTAARAAATRAAAENQFDRAIRLLEKILDTGPQTHVRAEVLLEIGRLINQKGLPSEALPVFDQVISIARTNRWPALFADAALGYWSQSPFRRPRGSSTIDLLTEADQMLGPESSIRKAQLLAKLAVFNVFNRPLEERDRMTARALEMAEAEGADDDQRRTLLEARHITFSCPAGAEELARLDPEIERLRLAANAYFQDAAAPETAALLLGRGDELRRVARGDADRIAAQPIAEWRDFVLRSTLAAFDGEIDAARDLVDRAAEIGEAFWGESSLALHGFSHFTFDLLSDDWSRSLEPMELLLAFDGSPIFEPAVALARFHSGQRDEAMELVASMRTSAWPRFDEHILGGNGLVAAAELAMTLDDDDLAEAAEAALLPLQHLVLGVPWGAVGLAAADPLCRLARRRNDTDAAAAHQRTAAELYAGLKAPALARRLG